MDTFNTTQQTGGMPVKVRQQEQHDCGVACLAMAADLPYAHARAVFVSSGLAEKRKRKPFASNFKDLRRALDAAGVPSRMQRYRGWDGIGQAAILKVFPKKNGTWHWVYAGRDAQRGLYLHDPATDLPTFETLPEDVMCIAIDAYQPCGFYIEIEKGIRISLFIQEDILQGKTAKNESSNYTD